eukprot:CAMPEP_0171914390 /NCGR_PEP_ID=MMETSP0993-20121228/12761_1 /TAXON_ID=483369 /ORGANISM="non described non described, Strain CCMP2098" /LENGTH=130 /DNA_ID=CAMNT_0012548875 /DNA_START=42 /DNA_END=434 /DNA_ORIENTATION=-
MNRAWAWVCVSSSPSSPPSSALSKAEPRPLHESQVCLAHTFMNATPRPLLPIDDPPKASAPTPPAAGEAARRGQGARATLGDALDRRKTLPENQRGGGILRLQTGGHGRRASPELAPTFMLTCLLLSCLL